MEKITKASVAERLTTTGFRPMDVFYDGEKIGSIVSYGKSARGQSRARTVYGSRIYGNDVIGAVRIEEEAASVRALMDKIAGALARQLKEKAGKKNVTDPAPESIVDNQQQSEPSPKF